VIYVKRGESKWYELAMKKGGAEERQLGDCRLFAKWAKLPQAIH
jgi:hypothetical protein